MIIRLPHVEPIDTLNIPKDFNERVKYSFWKFTEMTAEDYTDEDRLAYLDNLRLRYGEEVRGWTRASWPNAAL